MIFLRFSREFTRSSKFLLLLEIQLCGQTLGKIWPLTMWPLAMAGGAGGRNPAAPARESAGKGRGEGCELTRDRFASLNGVEGLPAGRAAAPDGDRRWSDCPDEWGGSGCVLTCRGLTRGSREGGGGLGRQRSGAWERAR
jgi:hypothetical protein